MANKFPLDFDDLKKGSIISKEYLEDIFGHKAESPQYAFACMGLIKQMEREMERRGIPGATIRQKNYEIHVLLDWEASQYNTEDFKRKMTGLFKDLYRMNAVDTKGFTEDQTNRHNRECEIQGRIVGAIATVTRKPLPSVSYTRIN